MLESALVTALIFLCLVGILFSPSPVFWTFALLGASVLAFVHLTTKD